jgi:hypothetical protein
MLKIAVVVAEVGLLVSGCRPVDPSQALVDRYCTALEEARTNEEVIERLYKVYEVSERAGELGMNEEEFGKAVQDRCGEAVREASRVARADEEAREEEKRALLDEQRIHLEECTDERAAGTITNIPAPSANRDVAYRSATTPPRSRGWGTRRRWTGGQLGRSRRSQEVIGSLTPTMEGKDSSANWRPRSRATGETRTPVS